MNRAMPMEMRDYHGSFEGGMGKYHPTFWGIASSIPKNVGWYFPIPPEKEPW